MQEVSKNNINPRLENSKKHIGGAAATVKPKSIMDAPSLDKRGMSISDYR